jgi:hypothetical protein
LAQYWSFSSGVGVKFGQFSTSTNGKQGPIPEEMSQTLLTRRSKETWIKCTPLTFLSHAMKTRINREKYTLCVIKSLEHQQNLKTCRIPYLGLELTMHVIKNQIHPVRQSLLCEVSEKAKKIVNPDLKPLLNGVTSVKNPNYR